MANTQVPSELIATNAISGTIIADNAITSVHIAQNQVTAVQIPDGSITATQIAADAVGATELAASSVVTASIQDDQVTGDKLANNITIAGTLGVTGALTANAGVVVDELTIDADTITATDDFIIDAVGDITLDADGGDITFKDGGSSIGRFKNNSGNFVIKSEGSDDDLKFLGNDGGSEITALTLDMSDAGTATFNHDVKLPDNGEIVLGAGSDLKLYHDGSNSHIVNEYGAFYIDQGKQDGNLILRCDDMSGGLHDYFYLDGGSGSIKGKAIKDIEWTSTATNSTAGHHIFKSYNTQIIRFDGGNNNIYFGTTDYPTGMSSSSYKQFKIGGGILADSGHAAGHNILLGNNVYVGASNDLKFTHSAAAAVINMTSGDINFRTHDGGGASADATATLNSRLYIKENGQIGINDTGPTYRLDINASGSASAFRVANGTNGQDVNCMISNGGTNSGDDALLDIATANGAGDPKVRFSISGHENYEIGIDNSDGDALKISQGSAFGTTDRIRIAGNKVYMQNMSPDIAALLAVQGSNAGVPALFIYNTNADSLGIRSKVGNNTSNNAIYEAINTDGTQWKIRNDGDHFGTDTSIGSLSDSRLKKDVTDLTYDIAKFKQYRPIEFNWINPELHKSASGKSRGFLAQEVKALDEYYVDQYDVEGDDIPLVDADKKAYSTKFGYKDAMYISVIKQLITRLETAEAKIAVLEG